MKEVNLRFLVFVSENRSEFFIVFRNGRGRKVRGGGGYKIFYFSGGVSEIRFINL